MEATPLFILFGSCEKFKNCRISCYQHITHKQTHILYKRTHTHTHTSVHMHVASTVKWLGTQLVFGRASNSLPSVTTWLVSCVFTNLKICLCLLALVRALAVGGRVKGEGESVATGDWDWREVSWHLTCIVISLRVLLVAFKEIVLCLGMWEKEVSWRHCLYLLNKWFHLITDFYGARI